MRLFETIWLWVWTQNKFLPLVQPKKMSWYSFLVGKNVSKCSPNVSKLISDFSSFYFRKIPNFDKIMNFFWKLLKNCWHFLEESMLMVATPSCGKGAETRESNSLLPVEMPSASTKPENKAPPEAADPMKQVLLLVEKKVRNLEKRKVPIFIVISCDFVPKTTSKENFLFRFVGSLFNDPTSLDLEFSTQLRTFALNFIRTLNEKYD